LSFYDVALPALLAYKKAEATKQLLPVKFKGTFLEGLFPELTDEEQDAVFAPMHEYWAPKMREKFLELRGFYLKNGQMIASNIGGMFPKRWRDEMQPLLDGVPSKPMEVMRPIIEADLGKPMSEIFSSFEEEPIGAASIGQVHRATLKNGTKVVVKVMYPDTEAFFKGDVFAMRRFCEIAKPEVLITFKEIEEQFKTEFDYKLEAKNADDIHKNLKKAGFDVIVPKIYSELCTKSVLVMEEVWPSEPLIRALERQGEQMAIDQGITLAQLLDEAAAKDKARLDAGILEDAYDAKALDQANTYFYYRDLVNSVGRTAYNWTVGLVAGQLEAPAASSAAGGGPKIMNTARIIDQLLEVHGHEVLIDGCFNGDPHPGNILMVQKTQKLALIDYGQVKRIKPQTRIDLSKSLLLVDKALKLDKEMDPETYQENYDNLVKHWYSIGFKTEKMLPSTAYSAATVYLGRDDAAFIAPLNFAQWMDKLQNEDPVAECDDVMEEYMMVFRVTLMLKGFGHALHHHRNLAASWKPIAEKCLKEAGEYDDFVAEYKL